MTGYDTLEEILAAAETTLSQAKEHLTEAQHPTHSRKLTKCEILELKDVDALALIDDINLNLRKARTSMEFVLDFFSQTAHHQVSSIYGEETADRM